MKHIALLLSLACCQAWAQQTFTLDGRHGGKTFDGIGIVNGGGATSVLLKDYAEPWRSQILDMVYKPKFGASVSALLAEIPGDGNSTQGSMPSHSHYADDHNYCRGYMWWVMGEAKRRNPGLTLDATAWSTPGWLGNYWTDATVDYYIDWLTGLQRVHHLQLDAVGCHNEKGESRLFAIALRKALNKGGFGKVKLHAFDNWPKNKLNFVEQLPADTALAAAVDIVSAHTFGAIPVTPRQRQVADSLGKPIWNTEDHIYKRGFDCLISIVECFNRNYIESGVTKVVNWYDIGAVYPLEPYSEEPPMLLARQPWSGHYSVRDNLWAYAHYGQFTEVGWKYLDDGCALLSGGGSVVTLMSPDKDDLSIIAETKGAKGPQTLTFRLKGHLPQKSLCVWRSVEGDEFVKQASITPRGGVFSLTLQPEAVYSISTTRGQQKGGFDGVPGSQPFPLPYADDFEAYGRPEQWGYLPHYTADIIGCFELAERPSLDGQCVHQTVGQPANSWAPDWNYYTVLGDSAWTDYVVQAEVWLNPGDEGGLMGRVCHVGTGYGVAAKGYMLTIDSDGWCRLTITRGQGRNAPEGDAEQQALLKRLHMEEGGTTVLDSARLEAPGVQRWVPLRLCFDGDSITGYADGKPLVRANIGLYPKGMAGLVAMKQHGRISTPYYDNLAIRPAGRLRPNVTCPKCEARPLYRLRSANFLTYASHWATYYCPMTCILEKLLIC